MKKNILALCLIILITSTGRTLADQISLLNSGGDAVAYIDTDDNFTIYMWAGEPVAYLRQTDVYGFNGNHIGWFQKGVIFSHDGFAACATKETFSELRSLEELKGLKSLKPLKSLTELPPLRPIFQNSFSKLSCSIILSSGQ